jgi:site-specific recombinase XerD
MPAISKRLIDDEQPRASEFFLWDSRLAGFGLRIHPTGRKVFVAQVRVGRTLRRVKIGPYGAFTVAQARERAEEIIRAAADGRDPQREKTERADAITVEQLCSRYLEAARDGHVMTRFRLPKRASTVAIDEGRVARHIVPLIGAVLAKDLKRSDVQRMSDGIASGATGGIFKGKQRGRAVVTGGAGTASRVVELLGGIYSWAQKRDLVPGPSPTRGVETMRGEPKQSVLSPAQIRALGKAIRSHEGQSPMAAAAIRLIALTGMRRAEACKLRWSELDQDGHCLRLEATKTGRSTRPIGKPALAVLRALPQETGAQWVFPRADGEAPAEMKKPMKAIFAAAGPAVGAQILRRTFASVAGDAGFGESTIAELLGHSRRGTSERYYVRRSDPVLIAAADKVAAQIAAMLAGKPG